MRKIIQSIEIIKYIYFISGLNPFKLYNSFIDFFIYYKKRKFSPEEILLYNMLSKHNIPKYKKNIYSNEEYLSIQKKLNPASCVQMTESKKNFYTLCEKKGIPTPKIFFYINKESSSNPKKNIIKNIKYQLNVLPDGHFIVKPSSGTHGKGIFFFTKKSEKYQIIGAKTFVLDSFTFYLSALGCVHDYIVQDRITNHTDILSFAPSNALQTIRVNSLIIDEECSIIFCLFKQAGFGQLVDNFNMGQNKATLWVVDLKTGHLIQGFQINENGYGHKEILNSPKNIYLPFWPETIDLVKTTSKKFLPLRAVGWDVAITNTGPVIIEGNCFFDPASSIEGYDQKNIYQQLKKQALSNG